MTDDPGRSAAAPLFDAAFVADPHPAYSALGEEGRAHRVTLPRGVPAWLLTGYEDCRRAFLDNDSYSKDMAATWTVSLTARHLPRSVRYRT